jgi:hypothetical protein
MPPPPPPAPPAGFGAPPPAGYPAPYPAQYPASPQTGNGTDGLSLAALLLGILSLPVGFCASIFGLPIAIGAIVCGIVARNKLKPQGRPTGVATAGVILGIIGAVISLVLVVFALALIGGGSSTVRY